MKIPPVRCFDAILSNFTVLSCGLQVKFKKDELHRLPEFDDVKLDVVSMSASTSSTRPVYPNQHQANVVTPTRQPMQQNQTKPLSSIPAHVRSEISSLGSTSISSTSNAIQADVKGQVHPTGLNTPITPRQHPPQRPNLNPPQHQHQPDRRVSFADHQQALTTKPPSTADTMNPEPNRSPTDFEADESFGFNSDDDALFALADLGPPIDADSADAGRPIGSDEGRPINLNEGHLGGGSADDTMIGDDGFDQQHQKKTELSGVGVVSASKLSCRELIAAALVSVEDKAGTTSDSNSLKSHGYGDEQASGSGNLSNETTPGTGAGTSNTHDKILLQANAGTNTSSSTSALGVRSSIPPPQQQQNQNHNPGLNLTSLVQQRYQRHMAQRQKQNENPNQMGLSSSSSRDESKRASTPSIGGFHFPPGIVCPYSFCRRR
jgi:DNA repair and recombination protein RAD52